MNKALPGITTALLTAAIVANHAAHAVELRADPAVELLASPFVTAVLEQPDGDLLIAGDFIQVDGQRRNTLARLNADGSLDAGWRLDADGDMGALVEGPDGLVYAVGRFLTVDGVASPWVVRFDPDGTAPSVDASWTPHVPATATAAFSITFDAAGGAALIGFSPGGIHRIRLADGTRDDAFLPPDGGGPVQSMTMVAQEPALVVAGRFTSLAVSSRLVFRADSRTGAIDADWNPLPASFGTVERVQRDGASHVVVAGSFTGETTAGATENLARIDLATGLLDPAWIFDFEPNGQGITSLEPLANGDWLAVGTFTAVNGHPLPDGIARIGGDGSVVTAFAPAAGTAPSRVDHSAELANGTLMVPRYLGGQTMGGLAWLDGTSGADLTPGSVAGIRSLGAVRGMVQQPGGGILLTGTIHEADGVKGIGAHRLTASLAVDAGFSSDLLVGTLDFFSPSAIAHSPSSIYVGGLFGGVDRSRGMARLDAATGASDAGWRPFSSTSSTIIRALAYDPATDHVYAAGGFSVAGTSGTIATLARFDAGGTGAPDPDWNPGFGSSQFSVNALVVHDGHLYVGGSFTTAGGHDLPRLARVSTATAQWDTSWRPAPESAAAALLVDAGAGRIYAGVEGRHRLDDGTRDDWRPLAGAAGFTTAMARGADGSIHAIGSFQVGCDAAPLPMVRVFPDSNRLDTRWAADFGRGAPNGIAVAVDGTVVVGGTFTQVDGEERLGLVGLGLSATVFSDGMGDPATTCVQPQ